VTDRALALAGFWALLFGGGCGGDWEKIGSPPVRVHEGDGTAPRGLHRVGNRIHDADGNDIVLRGVNRSGSEYQCTKPGAGIFDGVADEASLRAMLAWGINAVRVPLNEACWLGIDPVNVSSSGEAYRAGIQDYVALLQRNGLTPILDLHWAAPGDQMPRELWPMPNADHSEAFWRDVALTFMGDDGVVLEPYNEPFPDSNRVSDVAWDCWLNGCEATQWNETETYTAVGMQALVDAIRETGAANLILLGGVQYSNDLSQFLDHMPVDPFENTGAAWHAYNFNACANQGCWDMRPGAVADVVPVVATEIGQSDCSGSAFLQPLMNWLDSRQLGYLAWSWNKSTSPCVPRSNGSEGSPWALITAYDDPEPYSDYAATFRDHLLRVAD
jgi:endoglucanase